jgi:hypothetical protein
MIRLLLASRNTYYVHIYIIILNKCIQREICLQKKKKKNNKYELVQKNNGATMPHCRMRYYMYKNK